MREVYSTVKHACAIAAHHLIMGSRLFSCRPQMEELRVGRAAVEVQVRDLTVARSSAEADAAAASGRAAGLEAACQAHMTRVTALSAQMAELQQSQARIQAPYFARLLPLNQATRRHRKGHMTPLPAVYSILS